MKKAPRIASLVNETRFKVRFSELDPMQIVWHGNYAKYFEDGREAFGLEFPGLSYADIQASGFGMPVVDMQVQFRAPLRVGDEAIVRTQFVNYPAAKICFDYEIRRPGGELVAEGSTMQVFVNPSGELELTSPQFFVEWKERWGVR